MQVYQLIEQLQSLDNLEAELNYKVNLTDDPECSETDITLQNIEVWDDNDVITIFMYNHYKKRNSRANE